MTPPRGPSTDFQQLPVEENHVKELTILQNKIERLKCSNTDMTRQLSDATRRMQRFAKSLGFDNVYEAQVALDTADTEVPYKDCLELVQQLERTLAAERAEVTRLNEKLRVVEDENKTLKYRAQGTGTFPLCGDVTEHLLMLLPNFSTLLSLISTSKQVYTVFQTRPHLITRAVAYNQLGPVLPQALTLVRCQAAGLLQLDPSELPEEADALRQEISREEIKLLARNATTVTELEDLFSWRQKDQTSRVSVLSQAESSRFQRAMYRIMLISYTYGTGSISDAEMADESYPHAMLEGYWSKQKGFLNRYTSAELYEVMKVARFLHFIAQWVIDTGPDRGLLSTRNTYDWNGLYLFAGPGFILECYKKCDAMADEVCGYLDDGGPYSRFITHSLESILQERGNLEYDLSEIILDSSNGGDDRCCRCCNEIFRGIHLWNVTNWDFLKGYLGCDLDFGGRILLKGQLSKNRADIGLSDALRRIDYSMLMCQLFDMRGSEYSNWAKEDWVCYGCVSGLFRDTIPFWWLQRKREAGMLIMRDCWCLLRCSPNSTLLKLTTRYGYDCPQQSQLKHALQFNHLCAPSCKASPSLSSHSGTTSST